MANKVPVGLRLDPDIKAKGERRAKEDRRSFASYVEWLIAEDTRKRALPPEVKKDEGAA